MMDGAEHVDGIHCDDINAAVGVSLTDTPRGPQTKRYSVARLNQLRNLVCRFPMEWNRRFYELCAEGADCEACTRVCPQPWNRHGYDTRHGGRRHGIFSRADVWNEIREAVGATDDYLWHVHPERFRHYANENLVHELNPYYGQEFSRVCPGIPEVERVFRVMDNPGFAPWPENTRFEGYAEPNHHFNVLFSGMIHAGVDFAVDPARARANINVGHAVPIHSFIHAFRR